MRNGHFSSMNFCFINSDFNSSDKEAQKEQEGTSERKCS